MTVFEQHIDLHQVEIEPTYLGFAAVILSAGIVAIIYIYLASAFINKKGKTEGQRLGMAFVGFIGLIIIFISTGWLAIRLTSYSTVTAEPRTTGLPSSGGKPHLVDEYREEINAGINDKLDDYTIDNVDLENDSVLIGGYYDEDITAYRNGKNYRLHPHWDFDKDSSTVTLNVDVEQLGFDRTPGK